MTEILARQPSRSFAFGPFVLDPGRHLLLQGDVRVRIGGRALDILTALVERPGELVSKRELMARAWPDVIVEEGNLKVNMAALRRVLGQEPVAGQYIATVVGRGYRFVAPVRSFESIGLSAEAFTGPVRSRGLQAATTRIFGRADVIDAVRRDLDESRVVSIVGAGGVGKTTVAIAAAQAWARGRAEGVTFIDLARIGDAQFMPAVIASALGLGITGNDPLAGVVHALKSQQGVLLFDNCEHLLAAAAAAVDRLARDLDGVRILATTREPLRLRCERVHRLRGLECDPRASPKSIEAQTFPAVELFATRASELARYVLTDADAPAAAEICRRLDGNALAIELAATQTAAFSPPRILQMLDDRFSLLKLGPPGAPMRQQSLLATLDWSYSLLSEREATMLRALSVFAGVFDVDGAAAVSNEIPAEALDTLAQVAAKSLVALDSEAGEVAYRLLETTRAYCVERLRVSGEEQAVRRRHAEFTCRALERAAREWAHRPARDWGSAHGRVLDDLRSALAWTRLDGAHRSLYIRLTVAGSPLWNHFSLTEEWRVHVSQALDELDPAGLTGTATEMQLQMSLAGATMFMRGPIPLVKKAMQRALDIAIQIGDTDYRLRCLRAIGGCELFVGEHEAALRTLETFSSVAAAADPSALPDGEGHLALAETYLGRLQSSRRRIERLYEHDLQDLDDPRFARFLYDRNVDVGNVLSNVQWLTGSPETAARTAEATVERALKTGHALSLANALAAAACPVFFLSGRHQEAGRYALMLDNQVIRHGIGMWSSMARFYRGALACAQDDSPGVAVVDLERAVAELGAVNHWSRMPFFLCVLGEALTKCGRLADAATTIQAALDRAHAQGDRWCVPELLRVQGSILVAEGHSDDAEVVLGKSMVFAQEIGALSWRLRTATDLAKLWRSRSRVEDARKMLQLIYNEFTEGFALRDLVVAADLLTALARPGHGSAEPQMMLTKSSALRRRHTPIPSDPPGQ